MIGLRQICYICSVTLPVILAAILWLILKPEPPALVCYPDLTQDGQVVCRPNCSHGHYSLPHMTECQPWLTCHQIQSEDFKIVEPLGAGAVKMVYLVEYHGNQLVYNTVGQPVYQADFQHGLKMLVNLQPSAHVTQLIGHCQDTYVTEYHELGTAENVNDLLVTEKFQVYDSLETRFGVCVSYARVIHFLHSGPDGPRVMCDSNDLQKTLNQFLLTPSFQLVANDLDALPLVNRSQSQGVTIKCGHRELFGDFVAPEQLWPYDDEPFRDQLMPGYDEKTDVWKIPDVCDHFLGHVRGSDTLRFSLFDIHRQCKATVPSERPSSGEVLQEYADIQYTHDLL